MDNDGFVYSTTLVPEYRTGDTLRTQWKNLRAEYATFRSKYDRSGQNNPDPTGYTTDLPTLLMHYSFDGHAMSSWAAKTIEDGALDDAGEGSGGQHKTRKRLRKGMYRHTYTLTHSLLTVLHTHTHRHTHRY